MNKPFPNNPDVTYTIDEEGATICVFLNGDVFRITEMGPADAAAWFVVEDGSVQGPERRFTVTINFDFYGDRAESENPAEIIAAGSVYASINYLDSHYFNQYVADRKANLIHACQVHEAHNV